MALFEQVAEDCVAVGMSLALQSDLMTPGKYPLLKNLRQYRPGGFQCRPGQTVIGAALIGAVHSLWRLNDEVNSDYTRLVGAGAKLYSGKVGFVEIDTGYSGNPLSFVDWRPDQSPEGWTYIADSSRMRKVRRDGTNYAVGIAPPNAAPSVAFGPPLVSVMERFDGVGAWTIGGTAGAITTPNRVNSAISKILYDTGALGWCSIVPVSFDAIDVGALVVVNAAGASIEDALVQGVFKAIAATTVEAISYDAGATGLCSVHPAGLAVSVSNFLGEGADRVGAGRVFRGDEFDALDVDPGDRRGVAPFRLERTTDNRVTKRAMPRPRVLLPSLATTDSKLQALGVVAGGVVVFDLGGANEEYCLIQSVAVGPSGLASIRLTTTRAHAAGETLTGVRSFRTYTTQAHAAGETLTSQAFQSTIAAGTGWVQKAAAFNFAIVGTRPVQDDDEIHISIKLDKPGNLIEGRIMFDVDPATNDFTRNYFYHSFRANDLIRGVLGTTTMLTARQVTLQNAYAERVSSAVTTRLSARADLDLDRGMVVSNAKTKRGTVLRRQAVTGESQWFDLHFKVRELVRVGNDKTRTLADVAAVRVQLMVTGATIAQIDSLWVGGTFGPDVGELGDPYVWRFRYRSTATGAKSNPGPPTRLGFSPHRQRVQLSAVQSPDAQVDKIDYFRWGGLLPAWLYVGTSDNTAAPSFNDDRPDQDVLFSDLLDFENFQPFPSLDVPKSGTCDVAGTSIIWKTGDKFNPAWAPGTIININGLNQLLYAQPSSDTRLEVVDNAGSTAGAKWFIAGPVVLAQKVAVIAGPFYGAVFGIGDPLRPGTLLWTRPNDPDAAPDTNSLELTSPSDPLMNGIKPQDGRLWVFSRRTVFSVFPSFDQLSQFDAQELPIGRGLYAEWFVCVGGGRVWIGGDDGIYVTAGGRAESITGDLYPLFPHDGQPGISVNGVVPPDMTQRTGLRLSFADSQLYFDYIGTDGLRHTLMYDVGSKGWWYDEYAAPVTCRLAEKGENVHATLLGCSDAKVRSFGGTTDDGAPINWIARTPARDLEKPRSDKLFGDLVLDVDPAEVPGGITAKPYIDNYDHALAPTIVGDGDRGRNHYVIDINGGVGQLARNIGLELSAADPVGVTLYRWMYSYVAKPEDTIARNTDWSDEDYMGSKFVQGVIIEADTENIPRTVEIQYDGGSVGATLAVRHNGQVEIAYSFPPFVAHSLRLAPKDAEFWRLFKVRFVWEPAPELAKYWVTQGTTHDLRGFQHVRSMYLALESTGEVTLKVNIDGTDYTYTVDSTAGAYRKVYVPLQAAKGKVFTYSLTSNTAFRVYQKDCEVRVRPWGSQGAYEVKNPFGDIHRIAGARI